MTAMKTCLPPVVGPHTRLLILGSLPGDASLVAARYYAHPRNHFWRLLSDVLRHDLVALSYDDRLTVLQTQGVGLWDTIASAQRPGSLDTAITGATGNDLFALAATLPELRVIAFNGRLAAKLGRAALRDTPLALIALPSSSPAYTLAYESKREAWLALRPYLA